MQRYFFDLVGRQGFNYDYTGRDLPTLNKACQLAELIALDYSMKDDEEWAGCAVSVCMADGTKILSVPVVPSWLAAS